MKCAVAIFAKTVGLSSVKTRLAADIGQEKAEAFYLLSVSAIEEVVRVASQAYEFSPQWALGEKAAVELDLWKSFPAIWTGEGGLGERLASVSERLFENHDAVMFIGTDSPQLTPELFGEAVRVINANADDCIVGPADDGGFYLLASQKPIPREVWEETAYSVESTLQELKNRSKRKFHYLPTQQDVDTASDLVTLQKQLSESKGNLLASQTKLLIWLNDYLDVAV